MGEFVRTAGVATVAGELQSVAGIVAIRAAIFAVFGCHAVARGMIAFFRLGHVYLQYSPNIGQIGRLNLRALG